MPRTDGQRPEPGSVLSARQLNRALLERQLLLERGAAASIEVIEHLVGMQSQAPRSCYVGLWSRIVDFDPLELERLLVDRRVVRLALQRSTIHLVSAVDCMELRPLLQPVMQQPNQHTKVMDAAGVDFDELADLGRKLVDAEPRTSSELGELLRERWPAVDGPSLVMGVRAALALVQVPPRGMWTDGGATTLTTAEQWLRRKQHAKPSIDRLVLRYLAAFGPASVQDLQKWSGLKRMKPVVQALAEQLVTFRSEAGVELFDLPDAPLPPAETPAPARLLAEFDNVILSHADRSRILHPDHKSLITMSNGLKPAFLVDGFVAGTWKRTASAKLAVIELTPFQRLPKAARTELEAEARDLLAMTDPQSASHEVRIAARG